MMSSKVKRLAVSLLSVAMLAGTAACSSQPAASSQAPAASQAPASSEAASAAAPSSAAPKHVDKLTVDFVPTNGSAQDILPTVDPFKDLLKNEMVNEGYDIGEVDITVGSSYEAAGEALSAGSVDVAFLPGGTYVQYDDGCDVILTATRAGLNKDSDSAKDWNDGQPTQPTDQQATSYRALMIAGPSAKGQALIKKVNDGQTLTFDDLNSANWSVSTSTSPAGYIYPALWLQKNFSKSVTDLTHAVTSSDYGSAFARLASSQVDVLCTYADARSDFAKKWTADYGRKASIWAETGVIGVTPPIYNDTVSVSKTSPIMDDAMKAALQTAFINIAKTDAGKKVIAIYQHAGYQVAKSSDYDNERAAQALIKQMTAGK